MVPTAISQVLENFGRVVAGLGLAYFFMPNVGYAAGGASFGSVVGGVCGALVLALLYLKHKKEIHEEMDSQKQATIATPFKSVVKVVLVLAIPISIGARKCKIRWNLAHALDYFYPCQQLLDLQYLLCQLWASYSQNHCKVAQFFK